MNEINLLEDFKACQKLLIAVGDEQRQYLISQMLSGCCGMRVAEIAEMSNLSRPAISHHMQILKNAGLVTAEKVGTRIFYTLNLDVPEVKYLEKLLQDMKTLALEQEGSKR